MPAAYFFHLAFELYPTRSPTSSSSSSDRIPAPITFTPPPQTDIFTSELPRHQHRHYLEYEKRPVAENKRPRAPRRHSHRDNPRLSFSERLLDADSPVPPFSKPAGSRRPRAQSVAHEDWRFDSVSIITIDMKPADAGLATKGRYIPSDPKNTEVGWGVVHLYREGQETPGLYDESPGAGFNEQDCTTLCILAVPSYMTPSDLLGFVGEETREDVSHFRLIRTARANKYMVLMKFREATKARNWRKEWNGKAFNSMEPEYCHVVFVKSITFQSDPSHRDPSSYPNLTNDPFMPVPSKQPTAPLPPASSASPSTDAPSLPSSLTAKPPAPPTPSLVELPTCPVCLERMDETTGLLTILCQHVFHCACLEKWRGSGCPVCRYTQNDALASSHLRGGGTTNGDGEAPDNECSVCGSTQNLWICLICGNTGCGRYDSAHAFAHYEATNHTYAMDVVSQYVWDYAGDGYVHRLIQNKADGKLVDLPLASSAAQGNEMTGYAGDTVPREKVDSMRMEYAYLLTSQLESQRLYFEEQVERAADKASKASSTVETLSATIESLRSEIDRLTTSNTATSASLAQLEKQAERNEKKAQSAQDLARNLSKQIKEEQIMNESLMTRIRHVEAQKQDIESSLKGAQGEKEDLEEQIRDLSFFISGQSKLKTMQWDEALGLESGEIEDASLQIGGGGEKADSKGKGKTKGKGKKKG
ncbi:unnamed protein product [Periconia digitata]|uniref:Zf-UBP-domain-containing protein n=1 Tax=Periconia digitata TaxID=1303443 RepID=A0A9W4XRZ0_9PLEO|nr:unnamed protein product [Periconia digitata]